MTKIDKDHRPKVARARRERMRNHILSVVKQNLCNDSGKISTLDEIISVAKISKGTFYKYYRSLDDAASELGAELARQQIIDMAAIYEPLANPVERTVMGSKLFLYRALGDRNWAACISYIHNLSRDNLLLRYISEDLKAGKELGLYKFRSLEITSDFVLGVHIEASKHIFEGHGSPNFVNEINMLLLRSLGVTDGLARRSTRDTERHLFRFGPSKLPWWESVTKALDTVNADELDEYLAGSARRDDEEDQTKL